MAINATYTITVVTTHPSKEDGTAIRLAEFNDFDDPYVTLTLSDGTDTVEDTRPLPARFVDDEDDLEERAQIYSVDLTEETGNVASTLHGMFPQLYDDLLNPPVEPEVPEEEAPAE